MYLNMASEATGPQERTEASCIVSDWVSQVKGEINKQTNWVAISDLNVKWSQNTVKIFPLDLGCKLNRKSCFICFFGTFGSRDNTFFLVFNMALEAILNFEGQDYPILGNHLEFYGQDSSEIQQIPFYQIWNLRIRRKIYFVCPGSATYLIHEILKYHCFCFSI